MQVPMMEASYYACKLQAERIYSEYWLTQNLFWELFFTSYLLRIVLGHASIHICAIRSVNDNAFCWISGR